MRWSSGGAGAVGTGTAAELAGAIELLDVAACTLITILMNRAIPPHHAAGDLHGFDQPRLRQLLPAIKLGLEFALEGEQVLCTFRPASLGAGLGA